MKYLIKNGLVVNENIIEKKDILISNNIIEKFEPDIKIEEDYRIIECEGMIIFPGLIDDQVHFREPGLTHKGNIFSESRAAVAGGVTSYFEMPNTNPQTTNLTELYKKFDVASNNSLANYSFMFGGTNSNFEEIKKLNFNEIPAIKIFLGSSTGDMLVDDYSVIKDIMKFSPVPLVVHSEDENIIKRNLKDYKEKFGDAIPIEFHPKIRSHEACLESTKRIIELALECDSRLHIFHLSTGLESKLFDILPLNQKKITSEVCIHHLTFTDEDYSKKGSFIKWNPAIKSKSDRDQLWKALNEDRIDIVATDHAPHTLEEKNNEYTSCPSGGPLVQHSLIVMFEHFLNNRISLEKLVQKMCHNPAILFNIKKRGFIKKDYYADIVVLDPNEKQVVTEKSILYKCGWSPFLGDSFSSKVKYTFVNGHLAYNDGVIDDTLLGKKIEFES
ncbi:MAG: dihydroorotase [Flavobacteriaceae bacterium]|nr:dihydroorotase [Flavobacteriaceae bacterium]